MTRCDLAILVEATSGLFTSYGVILSTPKHKQ